MSTSHARCLACALALTLALAARAQQPPPPRQLQEEEDGQRIHLRLPGRDVTLVLYPTSIVARDLQLLLDEDNVRGNAFGRTVFLNVAPGDISGLVGAMPTWFTFAPTQEAPLLLEGTHAGAPLRLSVGPEELLGTVGPCTYDLDFEQDGYRGTRVCTGLPRQPVWLSLPPGLLEEPSGMEVSALVVLLGA